MMEEQPSTSSDTGGSSTESQKLNRDIALIYKALQAEREAGSEAEESEEDDEESGGETEDDQASYISHTPASTSSRRSPFPEDEGTTPENEQEEKVGEAAILIQTHDGGLAPTPETCLALNRAYQEVLADSVKRLRLALSHNRDRQSTLEDEIENDMRQTSSTKKNKPSSNFSYPYFKDVRGMVPPGNSDTLLKKLEYDPYEKQPKLWTEDNSQTLLEAVCADGLKRQMQPLMNRKELEVEKLGMACTPEERIKIETRIEELDRDILRVQYLPKEYRYCKLDDEERMDQIDWMKIVAVDFAGEFSEQYLRQVWCNLVHPDIRRTSWESWEDEQLYQLACNNKFCDWASIAQELGTNRTAFQCLQRFQTKLSPSLCTGKWLPEEDEVLKEVVDNLTLDKHIPWHQVAMMMEGRTIEQCEERWKTISQTIKKGRWTTDEDMKLLSAVHCYGKDWTKVQEFIPERNAVQCRERYINSMAEDLRYGNWTYEEDRDLILLVTKYGAKKWASIAKELPGRTDNMVIQRYRRLLSWQKTNKILVSLPKDTVEKMELVASQAPKKKRDKEVVKKVGRLLKHRQTEQRARQIERVQDLTEMDPAGTDNIQDSMKVEESEIGDPEDEQLTQVQLMRQRASELLEKIAKRTYSERQDNFEREQQMIEQDLKEGIYVPRPPDTSATRVLKNASRHGKMNQAFMECVRETLKTTAKGDPEQVFQKLAERLSEENLLGDDNRNPSIRSILEAADKQHNQSSEMRRKQSAEVESRLVKFLQESSTTRRAIGRPRKFLGDDIRSQPSASKYPRCNQVEKMISNLMLTTLNVDKVGAQLVAHAVKSTSLEHGEDMEQNARTATTENPDSSDAESFSGESVSETASGTDTQIPRKKQSKAADTMALLRGCDEYDAQVLLTAPTDDTSKRAIKVLESVVPQLDRTKTLPLPKAYRKKFIGKAEHIYSIPPLPPCTSSLNAFKMILLDRRNLLKKAGHYYTGGILGRWRPQTQTKPVPNPSDMASMYAREGLKSSDLTPQRMKKLSIHFAMKDIKMAKQLLEQSELEQKAKLQQVATAEEVEKQSDRAIKRAANRRRVIEKARQTHDYELLKARFQSIFLWPAMLSTFTVRDANEEGQGATAADTASTSNANTSTNADSAEMPPPPPKKRKRMAMTSSPKQRKIGRGRGRGRKKAS